MSGVLRCVVRSVCWHGMDVTAFNARREYIPAHHTMDLVTLDGVGGVVAALAPEPPPIPGDVVEYSPMTLAWRICDQAE